MITSPPIDDARVYIFDTTLRDGEQSPGVSLTAQEKVDIARQLSVLGVDICEAGFPAASEGDFNGVQRIAQEIGPLTTNRKDPMRICALARAVHKDIELAVNAVMHAPLNRVHTFLATSDIHLQYKLRISRDQCVARATDAVAYALQLGAHQVEFSPEDAVRSDPQFLCTVLAAVIQAGATVLNIPDTVGFATPESYHELLAYLIANTQGSEKAIWSTHCHNDLGLATANSLAGVRAGCRQIEVAVNGIGERAGNTALEEVVMGIYMHPKAFPYENRIDTTQIYKTSQLVCKLTGMQIQRNKAIVGTNAFAHESGIHQDGVLKHAATYEIMDPSVVGVPSQALVLGKHSGRAAVKARLVELGFSAMTDDLVNEFMVRFKRMADAAKQVTDADIMAIATDLVGKSAYPAWIEVLHLQAVSGTGSISTATVELAVRKDKDKTEIKTDAATSRNGPVHACFRAIERLVGEKIVLNDYEVRAVSAGGDGDALGIVKVVVAREGFPDCSWGGSATDLDIVRASALAFVDALNAMKQATR